MAWTRSTLRDTTCVALMLSVASLAGCGSSNDPLTTDGGSSNGSDGDGDGSGNDGGPPGSGDDDSGSQQGQDGDSGGPGDGDGDGDGSVNPGPQGAQRAGSIPIGIENVNDSPLKAASYRALLRFVPDATISIDRFYFGYKLRGADCWDAGNAGYGGGDGGTLHASLVHIDEATGLPGEEIISETVNGCTRHDEGMEEFGSIPVLTWVNTPATLEGGKMYGLIVRNVHDDPADNFFSFNMPLAGTDMAGPQARNELDATASGAIMALDPREHVAWSEDGGSSWQYGSDNGQYRSYLNDHDQNHPATRIPQYGFRLTSGTTIGPQPYYAYSTDCVSCTVAYANARYARTFSEVGGFIAADESVGTVTLTNTSTGESSSCTPALKFGLQKCTLPTAIDVAVGESYTVRSTGAVEIMKMDFSQRTAFPSVGTATGELRWYQPNPASGTNAKDVPSLWAGPVSAHFPGPDEL